MAAQEGKEGTICARCFAPVEAGEAYCPDCGAPLSDSAQGADSAVHGELAQANLMRLRGDLDGSEKSLLSILRRFPNDPFAHEMLGDVCAERGENERAKEWYELALDLSPNSPDVRRKLQESGDRKNAQTIVDTAEALGLPSASPAAAWWPLAVSGGLLLLAILVAAWPRSPGPAPLKASLMAPADMVATVPNGTGDPEPPAPQTVAPVAPPSVGTEEDRRLLTALQARPSGSHVQGVVMDPRTGALVVTFEVAESDDAKAIALEVGREALVAAPTVITTTLRAVREGKLVFAADLARTAMDSENPLTNLWPAPTESPYSTSSGATPAIPSGTTGETTPTTIPPTGGATTP